MAISKVILNGDTLMDVTSNTVTAETLKTGYTATKNDGTSVTGEYKPKLQYREAILEDGEKTYAPGENIAITGSYTLSAGQHNWTSTGIAVVSRLQTVDTSKKYNIFGFVKIVDTEGNLLEEISINDTIDPTFTGTKYAAIPSNDYIINVKINNITGSTPTIVIDYNSGTFGVSLKVYIVENEEEYEGLGAITVQLDGVYGIYECIAERTQPIIATGYSYYKYTAADVSNWCNSFSGQITGRKFDGVNFSGSFYFNNVTDIQGYCFARAWNGGGNSDVASAYLYFPSVSSIGGSAFLSNGNLKFISAPNCVTLQGHAFEACANLQEINFINCQQISGAVFQKCVNLSSINFPECSLIGNYAFQSCTKLNYINFPKCEVISYLAFMSCTSLTSVNFISCTNIGSSAFRDCSSLTSINFPVCINIGSYAFANCSSLISINFPKCEVISNGVLASCTTLVSVNFPSCSLIGSSAFYNCKQLSDISFPVCQTINNYAFINCSMLTMANFPNCLIIGSAAFTSCINLSLASFPNCSLISHQAFYSCYNLLSLYLMGSQYVTLNSVNAFYSTPLSSYTTSTNGVHGSIYVPSSMLETYKTMSNWSYYSSRFVGI